MTVFRDCPLAIPLTCPDCGADVELLASGKPAGWQTNTTIRCTECSSAFVVAVELLRATAEPRCGTEGAYTRHLRNGEPIDDWCRLAHNDRTAARLRNRKSRARVEA